MEEKDKMGFVQVENWNGEKGYIKGDLTAWQSLEIDGIKYLYHSITGMETAYRIVREGEDTAVATIVRDKKVLKGLEKAIVEHLREYCETDPTPNLTIGNRRSYSE